MESVLWETELIFKEEPVVRGTDLKPRGDAHRRPLLRTVEGPPPGGKAYAAARVKETDVVVNTLGHGIHAALHGVRGVSRANRVASHIAAETAKTSSGSARAVGRSLLAVGDRSPGSGTPPMAVPTRARRWGPRAALEVPWTFAQPPV